MKISEALQAIYDQLESERLRGWLSASEVLKRRHEARVELGEDY